MSGGHFNYEDEKLNNWADEIYLEKTEEEKQLAQLLRSLRIVLRSYDYWKSGDHSEANFLVDWKQFKEELWKQNRKEKNRK